MKNYKKITKGFTLVEIILYVSLFAIIIFIISSFFITLIASSNKNQVILEVETQGRMAMEYVLTTIRNSEAIVYPIVGNAGNVLSLDVYGLSEDPTTFNVSSGVLQVTRGVGGPIALTNNRVFVSNLNFSNLSKNLTPGTIQVGFILSHINTSGKNEYEFTKNFSGSASLR